MDVGVGVGWSAEEDDGEKDEKEGKVVCLLAVLGFITVIIQNRW